MSVWRLRVALSRDELSAESRKSRARRYLLSLCLVVNACAACGVYFSRARGYLNLVAWVGSTGNSTFLGWGGGSPGNASTQPGSEARPKTVETINGGDRPAIDEMAKSDELPAGGAPAPCTPLTPSSDAVVYWPNTLPPLPVPAPTAAGAEAVGAIWRLELCPGVRGHEEAFELSVPGTLALLQPPAGDLHLARVSADAVGAACPPGACEGVIRASRLVGCPSGSATPPLRAGGTAAASFVDAARLGPDELDVTLEGPEFLGSIRGLHVGRCVYEFPYAVMIPGVFRLLVIAVRSEWRAVDESIDGFPPVHFDRISGSRLLLTLPFGGHLGLPRTEYVAGSNVSLLDAQTASLQATVLDRTDRLKQCSSETSVPGRWVRRSTEAGMFDAPTPQFSSSRSFPFAPGEGFYTDRREALVWLPLACQTPTPLIEPREVQLCMKRVRAVDFVGDSQTRVLCDHLLNRALLTDYFTPREYDRRHCLWFNSSNNSLGDSMVSISPGGYRVCFDWDAMGRKSVHELLVNETGAVVVNFGQHFYAENRRPVHNYTMRVRERFRAPEVAPLLAERAAAKPSVRLVWVETTPFSIRNDNDIIGHGDWRTTHRLSIYNSAAKRELAPLLSHSKGPLIRAVASDDVLAPLADTYVDAAHPFGLTAALDVILARVLEAICK